MCTLACACVKLFRLQYDSKVINSQEIGVDGADWDELHRSLEPWHPRPGPQDLSRDLDARLPDLRLLLPSRDAPTNCAQGRRRSIALAGLPIFKLALPN